jgi:hypothetical protein
MMLHNPPWTWTEPVEVRAGLETPSILVTIAWRYNNQIKKRDDLHKRSQTFISVSNLY